MSDSSYSTTGSLQGSIQSLYETAALNLERAVEADRRLEQQALAHSQSRARMRQGLAVVAGNLGNVIGLLSRPHPAPVNPELVANMLRDIVVQVREL